MQSPDIGPLTECSNITTVATRCPNLDRVWWWWLHCDSVLCFVTNGSHLPAPIMVIIISWYKVLRQSVSCVSSVGEFCSPHQQTPEHCVMVPGSGAWFRPSLIQITSSSSTSSSAIPSRPDVWRLHQETEWSLTERQVRNCPLSEVTCSRWCLMMHI